MPCHFNQPYQDWYAIVVRMNPEIILAVDRSLTRGWMLVRLAYPDIGPEDLAFRTLSEKEFNCIADSVEEREEPPQSRISPEERIPRRR